MQAYHAELWGLSVVFIKQICTTDVSDIGIWLVRVRNQIINILNQGITVFLHLRSHDNLFVESSGSQKCTQSGHNNDRSNSKQSYIRATELHTLFCKKQLAKYIFFHYASSCNCRYSFFSFQILSALVNQPYVTVLKSNPINLPGLLFVLHNSILLNICTYNFHKRVKRNCICLQGDSDRDHLSVTKAIL